MFCRDRKVKKMEIDLNQAVDDIYQGRQVSPEAMSLVGKALLLASQGHSPEHIAKELELEPDQVRETVIRSKGWEISEMQKQG